MKIAIFAKEGQAFNFDNKTKKCKNMNIEARKISIVQRILNIDNEMFIEELERKIIQLLPKYEPSLKNQKSLSSETPKVEARDTTSPRTVDIRKNVSLDDIVAEQETKPIDYAEIQVLAKETKWEYSLKELLEAIN